MSDPSLQDSPQSENPGAPAEIDLSPKSKPAKNPEPLPATEADARPLSDRQKEIVASQCGAVAEIVVSPEDRDRNITWRTNHILIVKAFLEILNKDGVIPTSDYLAEKTGLDIRTIERHLEKFKFQNYKPELKLLTYPAAIQLARTANTPGRQQVNATKLLFQLAEDWVEGMKVYTETGKVFELGRNIITIINEEIEDIEIKTRVMLKIKHQLEGLADG